jgi:hypothetical protein
MVFGFKMMASLNVRFLVTTLPFDFISLRQMPVCVQGFKTNYGGDERIRCLL